MLLNDYVAHHNFEDCIVSLAIFLTDGKPTVNETHTLEILDNTLEAARGRVCIFTVGIRDDVDFRLLEELSLENCGFTWCVHEDEDASAQLIRSTRVPSHREGGTQREAGTGGDPAAPEPASDHRSLRRRCHSGS